MLCLENLFRTQRKVSFTCKKNATVLQGLLLSGYRIFSVDFEEYVTYN